MIKKQIKMERSPFHKTRSMKAPRGSENLQTQVSQDMFEDFMLYARHYNAQHKSEKGISNKANPLKHIVNEFLNSHALERKSFNELHVIMVFNKIDFQTDFDIRNIDAAVIGFVEHPEKFTKFQPFRLSHQYKQNIIYVLEDFNKHTFDKLNLKSFDRQVLFDINPSLYDDFDTVREHLQKQKDYEHIDFMNAQICMFNLNNYIDILQDGVYVSEQSKYEHDGFVVLIGDELYTENRIIIRFNWSYLAGRFTFEAHVENVGLFNTETCFRAPYNVFKEYWSITSGFMTRQAKLERNLKLAQISRRDHLQAVEMRERQIAKIKKELDDLKNN